MQLGAVIALRGSTELVSEREQRTTDLGEKPAERSQLLAPQHCRRERPIGLMEYRNDPLKLLDGVTTSDRHRQRDSGTPPTPGYSGGHGVITCTEPARNNR